MMATIHTCDSCKQPKTQQQLIILQRYPKSTPATSAIVAHVVAELCETCLTDLEKHIKQGSPRPKDD